MQTPAAYQSNPIPDPIVQQPQPPTGPAPATPIAPAYSAPQTSDYDAFANTNTNNYQQMGAPAGQQSAYQMPQTPVIAARKPRRKRKIVLSVLGAVIIAGLAGGYVFGMYLPAKPENVWNTAFDRTGKALDSLVETAANDSTSKAYEKLQVNGTVDVTSGTTKFNGTVDGKFDPTTANGAVTVNYNDPAGKQYKLAVDLRSQQADGETYPNSYLRLNGLKVLGLDALIPGISDYDNKWIYISSDYLKSLAPITSDDKAGTEPQVTKADVIEVSKAFARVTDEYVFTTNPAKAVVINKQFVGKETSEGVAAYHYKAGINKSHAKDYCTAVGNALADTAAYKKFAAADSSADATDQKASITQSCEDGTKDIKDTDGFDLWVEQSFKLIQKVRFTDSKDTGAYIEVGQGYNGTNVIPQFARYHSDKDKLDLNEEASLDTASKATTITVTGKQQKTDTSDGFDMSLKLNMTPFTGTVPFDKPANSIPLTDVFKRFGIDPTQLTSPTGVLQDDTTSSI